MELRDKRTFKTEQIDLIFVHVPKAGGTSIVLAVEQKYGDGVFKDYGDRPSDPESPMNQNFNAFLANDHAEKVTGMDAIVGHFCIRKYQGVDATTRACTLRHPLERTISNYFYWKGRKPEPANSSNLRFHAEQPSIEEFARYDLKHNFYVGALFRDVDMNQFDYVADFGDLSQNWEAVMTRLGLPTERIMRNTTQVVYPGYDLEKAAILEDAQLMGRMRALLSRDIEFFEKWVMPLGGRSDFETT